VEFGVFVKKGDAGPRINIKNRLFILDVHKESLKTNRASTQLGTVVEISMGSKLRNR